MSDDDRMIPRVLEPEVMDTAAEAADYDSMDHSAVNRLFVDDLLIARGRSTFSACDLPMPIDIPPKTSSAPSLVLDVGTGTAQIPIELASRDVNVQITAIDLAEQMLAVGRRNVAVAGLANIQLALVDAKQLPDSDGSFEIVMSNSIVHHIPNPTGTFAEMRRVLRPGGLLFVRDLLRPDSADDIEHLVSTYAGRESPRQQQLFRQSLHAALTLDELREILASVSLDPTGLSQTSDRHWTLVWRPT